MNQNEINEAARLRESRTFAMNMVLALLLFGQE